MGLYLIQGRLTLMLKTSIAGIELKNPVIAASGTFGFGQEFEKYIDLNKLGGLSTNGITLNAKAGNPGQRVHETASGMMNSVGLQNDSIQAFIDNEYRFMSKFDFETIVNLSGNSKEDYIEGIKLLEGLDINIIELNISCPNIKEGGMAYGMTCMAAEDIVTAVRKVSTKHIMVKLTPNAHDLVEVARACEKAGADSLSLVNTFNALAIDIYKRKPVFNNVTAGLSGPAIKPIALRMVRDVSRAVKIPVIGMGGIMTYEDAIEYIMAGATAIQVGTANLVNPRSIIEIIEGIEDFMKKEKIKSLDDIRGII